MILARTTPDETDLAEREMRAVAVRYGVEGDDRGGRQRRVGIVPAEADVLRWIERHHVAPDLGFEQPEPHGAPWSWLELRLVQPARQAIGRGHEREDHLARSADLGLQLVQDLE